MAYLPCRLLRFSSTPFLALGIRHHRRSISHTGTESRTTRLSMHTKRNIDYRSIIGEEGAGARTAAVASVPATHRTGQFRSYRY
jgi:hypothetical protein